MSPHELQERDRIAEEREEALELFTRFAPIGRDWWEARQEDVLPTLAEEMASTDESGS